LSGKLPTTRDQRKAIEKQKKKNQHIPRILIDEASNLSNVTHREELQRFADGYRDPEFENLDKECNEVQASIHRLHEQFFPISLSDILDRGLKANRAACLMEKDYREHFIHPFQLFLLGSVIMDRFYDKFQLWYDKDLCTHNETCLEASWLLTTIFHDRWKDIDILQTTVGLETGSPKGEIPNESEYLRLLSSFYNHRSAGNSVSTWNIYTSEHSAISNILSNYSERWSHGVKSSVLMMRNICRKPEDVSPRDVSSAFAIAVHDNELWDDLLAAGIFPLRIDLFPVACLLLYLDTIHEWGREQMVGTDICLVGLLPTDESVTFEVAFESPHAATRKLKECERAQQCLLSPDLGLFLSIKVRVHQ
jgi:hypothetical protein